MNIDQVWQLYRTTQEKRYRDTLVESFLPLVKRAVGRVRPLLPGCVDENDLYGYGCVGLLEAIDGFDLHNGTPFEAYAAKRIRGAIMDGLRSMNWLPRSLYDKAKKVEAQIDQLRHQFGREPEEEEIAEALGLTLRDYRELLRHVSPVTLLPWDELSVYDTMAQEEELWQRLEKEELLNAAREAITTLSERDQLVINLYFYEELTLKEIGAVLEVTEARACQLKTQALLRLRSYLHRHFQSALP
jgi:RNA polymerase sigma factor for flagellar operon FliA